MPRPSLLIGRARDNLLLFLSSLRLKINSLIRFPHASRSCDNKKLLNFPRKALNTSIIKPITTETNDVLAKSKDVLYGDGEGTKAGTIYFSDGQEDLEVFNAGVSLQV